MPLRPLVVLTIALLGAGCADDPDAGPPDDPELPAEFTATTSHGSYDVHVVTEPTPLPLNELFGLRVEVTPRADAPAVDAVSVDADMPEHGHGMNTRPQVTAGEGTWRVEGMLFHMPGTWELYVDVESGGIVERAVIPIELRVP